ncbi:hypothetical protein [Paenibacillus naphthalenovorans]|uniref:Uncharacterized protein n=1 Tax=Paenibacillus naphthalenovorans TaxID=162209 RepID=A0A0U2IM73_9BACL|nr:hypothetical protein [Paenibacillus naphthalenovorans]ALS22155.1 hypothetical protein IJ22_17810 [Paenibacillus naphthalenovorans]
MIDHLKKHSLLYVIGIIVVVFGVLFPDFSIEIYGGLAWLAVITSNVVGLLMVYCGIFGGTISYTSEGLIPTLRRWLKKSK